MDASHSGFAADQGQICPTGRRRFSRLRAAVPAQLLTLSARTRASLCDLSLSGAGVWHGGALATGDDCLLRWLEFEAFGSVVWSRGEYAGITFDEPLSKNAVLTTRERADHGLLPDEKKEALRRAREWYFGWKEG